MSDQWNYFYTQILPTLQAMLYPLPVSRNIYSAAKSQLLKKTHKKPKTKPKHSIKHTLQKRGKKEAKHKSKAYFLNLHSKICFYNQSNFLLFVKGVEHMQLSNDGFQMATFPLEAIININTSILTLTEQRRFYKEGYNAGIQRCRSSKSWNRRSVMK